MQLLSFSIGGVTYTQRYRACGRSCAKCPNHGPYWYAYWWSNGKTKCAYIGAQLPNGIEPPALSKVEVKNSLPKPELMAPRTAARLLGISLSYSYERAHARKAKLLGEVNGMTDEARLQRHEIERAWEALMHAKGW